MLSLHVCQICGHVEFGAAPEACPVCFSPKEKYQGDPQAVNTAEKEGKEKHIPQIIVTDDCGLIPDVCRDVHVKVGSVPHPMTDDHYIQWIDAYVNKKFLARYMLTPGVQPAVGLHLKKEQTGTLTVIESCNKHGRWIAEAPLS